MDSITFTSKASAAERVLQTNPAYGIVTLSLSGSRDTTSITCKLSTGQTIKEAKIAGLYKAVGGDGLSGELCSGDMLLEALVACSIVILKAVSTAL